MAIISIHTYIGLHEHGYLQVGKGVRLAPFCDEVEDRLDFHALKHLDTVSSKGLGIEE